MNDANYRKHNDRSLNSSTYHKKDGTPSRQILKREAEKEITEEQIFETERWLDSKYPGELLSAEESLFRYIKYLRDQITRSEYILECNDISVCVGDGTFNAGCEYWTSGIETVCPNGNGMILSIAAIREAAKTAKVWLEEEEI